MKSPLRTLVLVGTLALGAGSVQATPIIGGIIFSDTFASSDLANASTSIISSFPAIPVDPPELAQGCTGAFAIGGACVPNTGTFASPFLLNSPPSSQSIFTYNGFTFTLASITGGVTRTGLSCIGTTCTDALSFDGIGMVTGNGLDAHGITIHWVGSATCTRSATGALACATGTASGDWRATIAAVPEPGSVALLGLGLGVLGLALRRSRSTR